MIRTDIQAFDMTQPAFRRGTRAVFPIAAGFGRASVHEFTDFFLGQAGALCDYVRRYAVRQEIAGHFELAFIFTALFDLLRRVPQKQWYIHCVSLPVPLVHKFPELPYKLFVFYIYNALRKEKQIALVGQAPSPLVEKFHRPAEKVEFLMLVFRQRRVLRRVKDDVYRVVARNKFVVVQLIQRSESIISHSLAGCSKDTKRFVRFK
jgi:hypothetical protein